MGKVSIEIDEDLILEWKELEGVSRVAYDLANAVLAAYEGKDV